MTIKKIFIPFIFLLLINVSLAQADDRLRYYDDFNPSKDFTLTNQDGESFSLKENRGKLTLLFFGYLSCPDVCPVTMSKISRVHNTLKANEKENVKTVFVSVDTYRDTPEKIKEYLDYFSMDAVGLTGDELIVDEVVAEYKAWYEKVMVKSSLGYLIDHTNYIYLIDQKGNVRYLFRPEDNVKHIAKIIRIVLKEGSSR